MFITHDFDEGAGRGLDVEENAEDAEEVGVEHVVEGPAVALGEEAPPLAEGQLGRPNVERRRVDEDAVHVEQDRSRSHGVGMPRRPDAESRRPLPFEAPPLYRDPVVARVRFVGGAAGGVTSDARVLVERSSLQPFFRAGTDRPEPGAS